MKDCKEKIKESKFSAATPAALDESMNEIDIDKELISVREQGFGFLTDYTTPIEKSERASEYLISNAGKSLDFDKFHEEFGLKMDKGGMLFPYDTLNWHTHIQLRRKGYEYKLFCIDDPYGDLLSWNRSFDRRKIYQASQIQKD